MIILIFTDKFTACSETTLRLKNTLYCLFLLSFFPPFFYQLKALKHPGFLSGFFANLHIIFVICCGDLEAAA